MWARVVFLSTYPLGRVRLVCACWWRPAWGRCFAPVAAAARPRHADRLGASRSNARAAQRQACLVAALEGEGEIKHRHLQGQRRRMLMRLFHAAADQRENIVDRQRHRKARAGRRAGMAEAADLAVQHAFQALKHAFDAPAPAIRRGHLGSADPGRQVGPQPDRGFAIFGGRIKPEIDAPPGTWPSLRARSPVRGPCRCGYGHSSASPLGWTSADGGRASRAMKLAAASSQPINNDRVAEMAVSDPGLSRPGAATQEWPACVRFGARPHPRSGRSQGRCPGRRPRWTARAKPPHDAHAAPSTSFRF